MLLTKTDLLPHVEFDPNLALKNARKIHPEINFIALSARTGEGFSDWLNWLEAIRENLASSSLPLIVLHALPRGASDCAREL